MPIPAVNPFDMNDKVAIVTGSSRGIGRAIADAMVAAGARVAISSRSQEACDETAAWIAERHGPGRALPIAANISDKAALEALVERTRSRFGPISTLVCNAATNPHNGPMADIADTALWKILQNNIVSSHWLISMALPDMRQRRDGSIVIVSSIGAMIGSETIGAYNISKAADLQMVRNLAVEHGKDGIRANAIAPGVVRTRFAKAIWEDPEAQAAIERATPLGRIGEPEDIAGAAVFLASGASRFMTGQTIVLDGGATVRGFI